MGFLFDKIFLFSPSGPCEIPHDFLLPKGLQEYKFGCQIIHTGKKKNCWRNKTKMVMSVCLCFSYVRSYAILRTQSKYYYTFDSQCNHWCLDVPIQVTESRKLISSASYIYIYIQLALYIHAVSPKQSSQVDIQATKHTRISTSIYKVYSLIVYYALI